MAGAWEVTAIRKTRVLVAVLSPPDYKVSIPWARCMRSLELPPFSDILFVQGLPFGPARNNALVTALQGGFGYLFFWDADVVMPKDTVPRLLATGRDYIGAVYHQRFPPFLPCIFNKTTDANGVIGKVPPPPWQWGQIIDVDFIPTGATLFSRRCMETVLQHYPRPFEWGVDIDRASGISEDFDFSLKAASVGFQPAAHTGIVCKHEILSTAGIDGLQPLTAV